MTLKVVKLHKVYAGRGDSFVLEYGKRRYADIAQKLETYDKLLLSYSHLAALAPAPKWSLQNLRAWFSNNPGAIMESESAFLMHIDELISIWKEKPRLRRMFEQYFVSSYGEVMGLFKKDARRMNS
ncbi:hypothetical protein FACUT_12016 [Fusarium acutatum]|uniref:DUF6594 domain-containing protein n=1 Tax=Fusarium acutatum TaxID=78861 RepID=A0A8H4JG08_9HYPO|nr:hypothetical protein FACUT_12016 [Fusarium acutatum]